MSKSRKFGLLVVAMIMVMVVMMVGSAAAVTSGTPDGEGHPFVGLMVAKTADGTPMWRCSGTLISPTVFLTAGHCTYGAARADIWFDADVQSLGVGLNTYPYVGFDATGTPYAPAQYPTASFVFNDVGVVVLSQPYLGTNGRFGQLPTVNQLDALKTQRGQQNVTFRAVGYGLQESFPDAASFQENNVRVRYVAYPHLLQINVPGFTGDFSLLLSNNSNTGGTCFGDSGGPNFLGNTDIVAGVTSFGINGNCAGTGGVFRMDRQWVLDWVNGFLD